MNGPIISIFAVIIHLAGVNFMRLSESFMTKGELNEKTQLHKVFHKFFPWLFIRMLTKIIVRNEFEWPIQSRYTCIIQIFHADFNFSPKIHISSQFLSLLLVYEVKQFYFVEFYAHWTWMSAWNTPAIAKINLTKLLCKLKEEENGTKWYWNLEATEKKPMYVTCLYNFRTRSSDRKKQIPTQNCFVVVVVCIFFSLFVYIDD